MPFMNGRTLEELIVQAKNVAYCNPNKPYDQWNDDEFIMKSIYIAVQHYEQTHSLISVCNTIPPLKIFVKAQLKTYIKMYSQTNPI
uniref:Uncharacterized protein n=1 Tax=viral metagenome TaxID=1070528 RepID=A0A6C0EIC2_9ZZZZ